MTGACMARGMHAQGSVHGSGVPCVPRGVCPGGVHGTHASTVNRMTDTCKNITLSQTSFAGGKY